MTRRQYYIRLAADRLESCELDDGRPVRELIDELIRQYELVGDAHDSHTYGLYTTDKRRLSRERPLEKYGLAEGTELWLADTQKPWWEPVVSAAPFTSVSPSLPMTKGGWSWRVGYGHVLPIVGGGIVVLLMVAVTIYVYVVPRPSRSNSRSDNGSLTVQLAASVASLRPTVAIGTGPTPTLAPLATATPQPTSTLQPTSTPEMKQETVKGVQPDYISINPLYFFRGRNSLGAYLFTDDQLRTPLPATKGYVVVSNDDIVEVVQDLGKIYQIRIVTNRLDPDDPKVIGAVGYIAAWLVTNENIPPIPTATPRSISEPPKLRVRKLNSNDEPICFSMQIRGIDANGWIIRVDGMQLFGIFDGAGNARVCGLGKYQEVTSTIYDRFGNPVAGGSGFPVRGGDIMIGEWR